MQYDDGEGIDWAAEYAARGVPREWERLTPEGIQPAFDLWYRPFPSPRAGVEGTEDAEDFIHNPIRALRNAGVLVDEAEPRVSTMVVNHEETLERFIMHAFVLVSTNPNTVGITIVKEKKPKPPSEQSPTS